MIFYFSTKIIQILIWCLLIIYVISHKETKDENVVNTLFKDISEFRDKNTILRDIYEYQNICYNICN